MASVAALLAHEELVADSETRGKWKLSELRLNDYVRLDAAAVRALNLLPLPGDRAPPSSFPSSFDPLVPSLSSPPLISWTPFSALRWC